MKSRHSLLVAVLLSLFATSAAYAQKSDREATYALLGPVKEMRTETADISKKENDYVEGPRILSMSVVFNEDGSRPELCLYNEKGALARRIVTKFEKGNETEFLNYDGGGRMWLRGVFLYDEHGRTRGEETYNGDGSLRSKATLKRNDAGLIIQRSEYGPREVLLEQLKNTFDEAGGLKTTERAVYREDGSLALKEFTTMADKRVESLTYNPDGSLAGRSVRVNQEITQYGADGSLIKKIQITNPARLTDVSIYEPDGTTRKESQIADEVDTYGNWIKQTKWITDAHGRRPVKVTYRTITYFPKLSL